MALEPKDIINKYLIMKYSIIHVLEAERLNTGLCPWRLKYKICTGDNKGKITEADDVGIMVTSAFGYDGCICDDLTLAVLKRGNSFISFWGSE